MATAHAQTVSTEPVLSLSKGSGQAYPAKSVRIIVPFAAGGNTDFTGRTIAAKLSEALGHQFIVDNRPGGSTNIGSEMIVKSVPDGYNILLGGAANAINAERDVSIFKSPAQNAQKGGSKAKPGKVTSHRPLVLPTRSISSGGNPCSRPFGR